MKVVIAGAGSVGRSIARELSSLDHDVTILDKETAAMRVASVPNVDWLLADACDPKALLEAGIDECDIVVAATGDDKSNLVVSMLSKLVYGVPRVIARVNNPRNEWLFDENWGVDVPVSTPRIMTALVEEALAEGDLVRMARFHRSGTSMFQTHLPESAPAVGLSVGEVVLPAGAVLTTIVRDGVPLHAERDLTLETGDQVIIIVSDEAERDLDLIGALMGAGETSD
ncbi:potassium channel family protein [Flaviflexus equikiangi]|uniref:Trk system potassium uptake protein TrkA n=1 Tax=Flaviflexus equikiangi TaxID=2758573 RepID=A0ABS2TF53_9ACTO|nr:TrkA family potassium uptake protein [Flaviflexus equikiangi]MBM9433294.1 TrkA family potassium uptake protein [Flaviflexus equikiangi]